MHHLLEGQFGSFSVGIKLSDGIYGKGKGLEVFSITKVCYREDSVRQETFKSHLLI